LRGGHRPCTWLIVAALAVKTLAEKTVSHTFDVVVAGCGPAGSVAGYVLARKGLSVAMLDKAAFPRKKLCGGLLTWKSMLTLEQVYGETPESLTRAGIIDTVADRYTIAHRDKVLVSGQVPYPFHLVDREAFDQFLLDKAVAAGATFFPETIATGCIPETGVVTTATGKAYLGRMVIGADGVNSVIRQSLSIHKQSWRNNLASTIEIHVPRARCPRAVEFPELYTGFIKAGYCWAFPNKEHVILGICGLTRKDRNIKALFQEFLRSWGLFDTTGIPFLGHPLPYGNYLRAPAHENALLAGDAAGFVEPLFGEGLFYAMRSGLYAALAAHAAIVDNADPRDAYLEPLKKYIFPEFVWSNRLRWFLMYSLAYFSRFSLQVFVGSHKTKLAEMVHGMRSYRHLRKKEWDQVVRP
jgi:geranylgeranyl reductase family protein